MRGWLFFFLIVSLGISVWSIVVTSTKPQGPQGMTGFTGPDGPSFDAVLPIANGGTNSSKALKGDRLICSSSTAIVETDYLASDPIFDSVTLQSGFIYFPSTNTVVTSLQTGLFSSTLSSLSNIATTTLVTIPSVSSNANVCISEKSNQIINGVKTFLQPVLVETGVTFQNGDGSIQVNQQVDAKSVTLTDSQLQFNSASKAVIDFPNSMIQLDSAEFQFQTDQSSGFILGCPEVQLQSDGTLRFESTRNQIRTSDTAVSVDLPTGSNVTITLPDVGADAEFVLTEGAQTVNGSKTILELDASFSLPLKVGVDTGSQIRFGSNPTNQIRMEFLYETGGTSSGTTYMRSFPNNLNTGADFMMTEGDQVINGMKIFYDVVASFSTGLQFSDEGDQIVIGGPQRNVTWNFETPSTGDGNLVYTIPIVEAKTQFMMDSSDQAIAGVKFFDRMTVTNSFSGDNVQVFDCPLQLTSNNNQIVLGASAANNTTINAPSSFSTTQTIPDFGVNASFVLDQGPSTINGIKTISTVSIPGSFTNLSGMESLGFAMGKKYMACFKQTNPQSIPSFTDTSMMFDTTAWNINFGNPILPNTQIQVPVQGYYLVIYTVSTQNAGGGNFIARIFNSFLPAVDFGKTKNAYNGAAGGLTGSAILFLQTYTSILLYNATDVPAITLSGTNYIQLIYLGP
jgi:hypothetical protein